MNRPTEVLKVLQGLPNHTKTHGANKWIEDERKYPEFVDFIRKTEPNSVFEIGAMLGYALVTAKWARPEITRLHWYDTERDVKDSNLLCEENIKSFSEDVDTKYWTKLGKVFNPVQCDLVIVDAHYHDETQIMCDFQLANAVLPKWVVGWGCSDTTNCILQSLRHRCAANAFHIKDTLGMWVWCRDYELMNRLYGLSRADEGTKSWEPAEPSPEDNPPVDNGDSEEVDEDAY
jgi:hypothetical protein